MKAYPYEIRSKAVKMHTFWNMSRMEIGRRLGIPHQTIGDWIKKASKGQSTSSRRRGPQALRCLDEGQVIVQQLGQARQIPRALRPQVQGPALRRLTGGCAAMRRQRAPCAACGPHPQAARREAGEPVSRPDPFLRPCRWPPCSSTCSLSPRRWGRQKR